MNYLRVLFDAEEGEGGFQQAIPDFFPAIIYVYDADTKKLRYINKRITETLGYTHDDIADWENDLLRMVFTDDVELVKEALDKFYTLKDEDSYSYNARLTRKQGDWVYFRTMGRVLKRNSKGDPATFLFVAQDISSELKSEEEIRAMRQLFSETEQLLQFGSWTWNLKTDKIESTQGFYSLLDYAPGEVDSKVSYEFYMNHVSEYDAETLRAIMNKAIVDKSEFEYVYNITTHTGNEKTMATRGKVVANDNGEIEKMVGITRDVTQVRKMDKQREHYINELSRSNKELEEFAYVASHDLQEPLRKITTFSERLFNKFSTELTGDSKAYLDRIMVATENMRLLIDNLLEFSRTTRVNNAYEKVELQKLAEEVKADLELKIDETNAVLNIGSMPVIEAIPSQMKQLFSNMLSNAIKFRKVAVKPVIDITSEKISPKEKDDLQLKSELTYYKIIFKDNGIGFEEEYSEKIFQIFQRLHGKAEYPGSGIGLAICKKIVENHSGAITVHSVPGEGSVFTIILPAKL